MSKHTIPKDDTPYLHHVDGLRFVALAGVFLFHFKAPGADGGFIGVDCFLVISGFLITRNILKDIRTEIFSFRDFYVRRFWRLYPSALVNVGVALLCSYIFFTGDLAYDTIISGIASLFFVANIHFYGKADYFDGDPQKKPLLHMWSLSLEEQFYCFWPLFIYFSVNRMQKDRPIFLILAIIVLIILSFCLSIYMFFENQPFSFYMLPCRLYEFGIGALLSVCVDNCFLTSAISRSFVLNFIGEVFSAISLFSVFASYFILQGHSSPLETLPVILATSILITTRESLVAKYFLSNPGIMFLGRLTYTAYLVHWTMYVFLEFLQSGLEEKSWGPFYLIPITMLLALIMKKSVEDRFRAHRKSYTSLVSFFLLFLTVVVFAFHARATRAWGRFFDPNFAHICKDLVHMETSKESSLGCVVGTLNASESSVYIIGDSFAQHFIPAFDIIGKRIKTKFRFLFEVGCPLVTADDPYGKRYCNPRCKAYNEKRWRIINGEAVEGYAALPENATILSSSLSRHYSIDERRDSLRFLSANLTKKGHRLFIISEPPGLHESELWRYSCLELHESSLWSWMKRTNLKCVSQWLKPRIESQVSLKYLKLLQKEVNYGTLINIFNQFCKRKGENNVFCKPLSQKTRERRSYNETGYLQDGLHLSESGSRFVSRFLYKQLLSHGILA